MQKKVLEIVLDGLKALIWGILAAIVMTIILFLIGFLAQNSMQNGMEVAKDGLFVIVALLLFLLAGLLMAEGKKERVRMQDKAGWKRHFKQVGLKIVVGTIAVGYALVAAVLDWIMLIA